MVQDDGGAELRVLLTGATGFVGRHLLPELVAAGHSVDCASRDPEAASRRFPEHRWVHVELSEPSSVLAALRDCDAAFYLAHGMAKGHPNYPAEEAIAADGFARAAERSALSRVVYLGGMAPAGRPSRHLASRLRTGEILRRGRVPTIELRASMIIGAGSASWRICRDLATRLPIMIVPRWLRSRTQPVAISDVTAALAAAVVLESRVVGDFDLPGPEILTIREVLERIAGLEGMRPAIVEVPLLTPRLSSYWIQLVARSDADVSAELVEGLRSDILARDERFWEFLPNHRRMPFEEAAGVALKAEQETVSRLGRALERTVRLTARKS